MIKCIEQKLDRLRDLTIKTEIKGRDAQMVAVLLYEILQHLKKNGKVAHHGDLLDD